MENIIRERIGEQFSLEAIDDKICIKAKNEGGKLIFDRLNHHFTQSHSNIPCCKWMPESEGYYSVIDKDLPSPGESNLPKPLIEKNGKNHYIHYDILGLTYWMLTRLEEVECEELDFHGRFPSKSSHAFKFGYLNRPVVDEWMDILKQVIQKQWPKQNLKTHDFKIKVTCDVDNPLLYNDSFHNFIKKLIGDLVKRKSIHLALKRLLIQSLNIFHITSLDPYLKGIRKIMDICNSYDLQCNFYFISDKNKHDNGIPYSLSSNKVKNILKEIQKKGHQLSLHPGYCSYLNKTITLNDKKKFLKAIESISSKDVVINSRQHYLRWKHPQSLDILDSLSFNSDSSLYYADHPGFRCGTCHEYKMFNPVSQQISKVSQIPLIFMDTSYFSEVYTRHLSIQEKIDEVMKIKYKCQVVNGNFVFLWHNCTTGYDNVLIKLCN